MVDDLGRKLVVTGDAEILSSDSLLLAVRSVDGTNFTATSVDIYDMDDVQVRVSVSKGRWAWPRVLTCLCVQLLSGSRSRTSAFPLGSVFLPSSLMERLSTEEQLQATRVQFTFYAKSILFQVFPRGMD